MSIYYNEFDPFAAGWIRALQEDGHLPDGEVDERSIVDVQAKDLQGTHQAHFFAGIGGWPLALRLAGWPEDEEVWTGSCPCQPFSVAGKAGTVGDERHLWPAFHRLISECRPAVIFGEQVESKDGRYWLAGVRDDLERLGYAVGAADLCASGVKAPHRRQRLYWVAYSKQRTSERHGYEMAGEKEASSGETRKQRIRDDIGHGESVGSVAYADSGRSEQRNQKERAVSKSDADRGVDDFTDPGTGRPTKAVPVQDQSQDGVLGQTGFWASSKIIACADGKSRRVPLEPSLFPLAPRVPGRVGLLRGAGGSIVPQVAAEFVRAFMEVIS